MATAASPGIGYRPGHPWPGRDPLATLSARLRGPWLDRQLAAGVEPWRTPAHRARSLQITGMPARRSLARSVDRLLSRATDQRGRIAGFSAAVPVNRRAVLGARGELAVITRRLRDGKPISTRGVAGLRELVCDGSGPLYGAGATDGLLGALTSIRDCLDVRE